MATKIAPFQALCGSPINGVSAFLCLTFAFWVQPARAQARPPDDYPDRLSKFSSSLGNLAERVSPAVVRIEVTSYTTLDDKSSGTASLVGKQHNTGTGFIVDSDGYIITNAHVVKNALRIRIFLTGKGEGSQVSDSLEGTDRLPERDAKVVGMDPAIDLAVLKIDGTGFPTLSFADYTKLKKGQIVLAFGNPAGFENSVTMGVVSAVARQVLANVPAVYIQTDAPINHGNSGGPLVDTDGKVVGVNTFILTQSGGSQGLAFAIPSSMAQFVYNELRVHGRVHHSTIGIELEDVTADLAKGLNLSHQKGVIVADVEPGGPADRAGIQVQDILLKLNGREIGSVPFAEMMITMSPAECLLKAEVLRGRQEITFHIPVKERETSFDQLSDFDPGKALVRKLGIFGVEVNDQLALQFPNLRRPSGVIVAALAANADAARTDLETGDVIHAVNGHTIETLDVLKSALDAISSGEPGVLQMERNGKLMYVTFEPD